MTTGLLVNIDVDDLAAAERFYCDALALRAGRRFGGGGVELLGASSAIYLLRKAAGSAPAATVPQPRDYARHWTPVHLDFVVDDVDAAVARAVAAGARLEAAVRSANWGRIALLADPFGHGFCLLQFVGRGYDEIADPPRIAESAAIADATAADVAAIDALHREAFPGPAEARLVEALRVAGASVVSRVARVDGRVVGHVVLSPVGIDAAVRGGRDGAGVLGVAPLAVLPAYQRRGIGAALMRDALERSRARGAAGLVLLGEPAYYRRFGFRPAREFGLRCRWPGTDEAFMALELRPGGLESAPALARYHEAFDSLD